MKVRVRDETYDGNEEPVMVILTPKDRELIAAMPPEATKYCQYPDDPKWVDDDYKGIKEWMASD